MRRLRSWGPSIVAFVLALLAGPSLHAGEQYTGEQVELHFRDAEISAVFHLFSSATGLNLVMATNHSRITGDFSDKWDAVLDKILETNGLARRFADNVLIIGRRGEPVMDPKLDVLDGSPAEPIAMNVWNARLTDVVKGLFEDKGLSPAKLDPDGPPLRGYVTVQVSAISPRKLLQLVLATNGYVFEESGGVIKIRLLPGLNLPATHDETALTMADDGSNISLRGTLTPAKAGSSSVALVELAGFGYLEAQQGEMIGKNVRIVEVKPDRVVVTAVTDEGTVANNNVTLRLGDAHGQLSTSVNTKQPGVTIPGTARVTIPANAGVIIGNDAAPRISNSDSDAEGSASFNKQKARCDAGNAEGCASLADYYAKGAMFSDGSSVPKDEARAAALYKKACDSGNASACADLAGLYRNGAGVPKNRGAALALCKRACDGGYTVECLRLGMYYAIGDGVPRDLSRSNAYYNQACESKDPIGAGLGCYALALSFERGVGVPRDAAHAAALYQKACETDPTAPCFHLGLLYEKGSGVPRDPARAAAIFAKACDAGSKEACQKVTR